MPVVHASMYAFLDTVSSAVFEVEYYAGNIGIYKACWKAFFESLTRKGFPRPWTNKTRECFGLLGLITAVGDHNWLEALKARMAKNFTLVRP